MSNNKPIRDARPRHIADLREYAKELAAIGELIEIEREVDWNLEIGAITRRSLRAWSPGSAIHEGEKCWRQLSSVGSTSRS